MITETLQNVTLKVKREEGVNIDGSKQSGIGVFDSKEKVFEFIPTPRRIKSAPKNTIVYASDNMNIRLQQSGAYRATIMIPANSNLDELKLKLALEITEGLTKMQEGA